MRFNAINLYCLSVIALIAGMAMFMPRSTAHGQAGVAIQPFTYPDITGAGSTTQLSTTLGCASLQMLAPSGNGASVRWGDASTSATRGGRYWPPNGSNYYPLSSLYVYIANGDKLQFVCFR